MKHTSLVYGMLLLGISLPTFPFPPVAQNQSQQYHLALLGTYELMEQKPEQSRKHFEQLISSANSPHAYAGFIQLLFATNQYGAIVSLMPKLETSFKSNLSMQLMFAQALAETGNHEKADGLFIALQDTHKGNPELTYLAAQAHAKKDPKKAIGVIDQFLNSTPFQPRNCIFYFLESQLYMNMGNKGEAVKCVQKSLDICPRFDKGWLWLGMLHEQQGKLTEAIKGYSTFLELTGPNKEVEQQINGLMVKSNLQQSFSEPRENSYLSSALSWYETKDYEKALSSLEHYLKKNPTNQQARLLKINILSAMNNLSAATQQLQAWMIEEPSNETWFKSLHLLYKAGLNKDVAIKVLHAVEQQHPENVYVVLYLADVYTRSRLFSSALAYHEKALTLTSQVILKTKIAFNMSMIHHQMNNSAAMKDTLDRGLQFGSPFPPLHNLAAYYYATYGRDNARAQRYLDQALAQDSDNPHFLDTQALIWYKQRDYKKSETLLKKLAAQEPNDHFIQLHLAKVENKLGKQKQSIASLNNALRCAQTDHEKNTCHTLLRAFSTTT